MPADQSTLEPDARLSLRGVSILEIASVTGSVLLTAWVLNPLQLQQRWLEALPGLCALVLMVHSHRVHGETLAQLGFTTRYFGQAVRKLALPMLMVGAVLVGVGYWANSLNFGSRFWYSLIVLPFWGLTQQYILQGFIYRRLKLILGAERTTLAIFLAAFLFALVHAPNGPLMLLTLIGGWVWTWVYERAPNLLALGLSHALMSAVAMSSLPAWFLQSMSIGYKYLIYQRF
ncbi:MAG TPA: CPBP family intramembrane glutamic endopeptidase [Blastocatellia bacterium]|nr:CPBP family intramembrane glutamic endopeptidase [Blastocatellia bacterium]